ncbi:MAG: D-alanyl-D-alanine carboxypeptidase [Rhodospirillaceae bacterium]|jgi:serine-type D-Ala-D-Ala carboxypeptidase (penicillin-binding protein 5/6)|nr:D-alanyl-D-alanine carboxypeptidase [Rhodospirillaceae bacterium]MBT5245044.1 D-alanyl-D-alanine carboxypeptidase [Rhodospirillaceae bacterium]MBT5561070.1 D-alanyl-D-alanine carboxypeptidase [Rhodospirillaceae bacterium]MBT6242772.1 D-alanyl-D-alanine carboxypeptidase [Rhodospirillaceae bacterium]
MLSSHLRAAAIAALTFLCISSAQAVETLAKQVVLMDAETGAVLFEKDANVPMAPASMSKLMTLYMVFERLRDGRLSLEDKFSVSENAWRKGGAKSGSSTMFLVPGKRVRIEDLVRGIIVQSGNDACIVIAEGISGSEEAFAEEMTAHAREIGLSASIFKNSTGWPHPEHMMSPKDLAILAKLMIEQFPEYYHYYSEKSFVYNGIKQNNRNPLIYKDMGADGLKTGHTQDSGYGLTASAVRGDRRLVLVVNGLTSKKERSREPERLLEWGFREFGNYALLGAGEIVEEAAVWLGTEPSVSLMIENELKLTLHKKARREMKVKINYQGPIPAPVKKGDMLATLSVTAPGEKTVEVPLVAAADVEQLGLIGRLMAAFNYILFGGSD